MRGSTEKAAGTWHPESIFVSTYHKIRVWLQRQYPVALRSGERSAVHPSGYEMGGHLGSVGHVFNLLAGDGAGRVDDADTKEASRSGRVQPCHKLAEPAHMSANIWRP